MKRFAVDAMGGDLGAKEVTLAVNEFVKKHQDVEVFIVGHEDHIKPHLIMNERVHLVHAQDEMLMEDSVYALLEKKEASIVKAAQLIKDKQADCLVTCGSTGAFVAVSNFLIKRLKGISRAALTTVIPTPNDKGFLLIDMGANADCTVENLTQFALMGSIYASKVMKIAKPRVALLSNGTEDTKGDQLRKETFKVLSQMEGIHFVGNVEGKQILSEAFDVLVTDGFTGNVMFKSMEGTLKGFNQVLKKEIKSSFISTLGGLLLKPKLGKIKAKFDDKAIGGAMLIGLRAPAVKAHGSSDAFAFENALNQAYFIVDTNVVSLIKEGIEHGN